MLVRIALAETPNANGRTDAFVIAWPLDNDARHASAGAAAAIRQEVGGLPVLVVAVDSHGDLHTLGDPRHLFALQELGLEGHSWVHFEIELPQVLLAGLPTVPVRSAIAA